MKKLTVEDQQLIDQIDDIDAAFEIDSSTFLGGGKPNTRVDYLYRDAGNYKTRSSVVLEGAITLNQIGLIAMSLDDGEHFLPKRVGLVALCPDENDESYDDELDHPWHEIELISLTDEPPTMPGHASALAHRFMLQGSAQWAEMVPSPLTAPLPEFEPICRRTEEPKLAAFERLLAQRGIASRRNGESFHAPILEVEVSRAEEAWQMLSMPMQDAAGNELTFDDIPDDDPIWAVTAIEGEAHPEDDFTRGVHDL